MSPSTGRVSRVPAVKGAALPLRAYVYTRLADSQLADKPVTWRQVVMDAHEGGDSELVEMASKVAEAQRWNSPPADWSRGYPGMAFLEPHGVRCRVLDCGDKLPSPTEAATLLTSNRGARHSGTMEYVEVRQCRLKAVAAGVLWACHGGPPPTGEITTLALQLKMDQFDSRYGSRMRDCGPWVTQTESDLPMFCHDLLHADHEKDFHSLSAFPLRELEPLHLYVWKASPGGELTVDTVVGAAPGRHPKVAHVLISTGHMRLIAPPEAHDTVSWLRDMNGLRPQLLLTEEWEAALYAGRRSSYS